MVITKTKKKAPLTQEELQKKIDECHESINRQYTKISNYQKKIDKMRKDALLEEIEKSGKTIDEVYAFLAE